MPVSELGAYISGALLLLALSGFFSGSEAAYFSLSPSQRRRLGKGAGAERLAHALLTKPERLLMGILFWNLAINIGYFSLVSKVSLELSATSAGESQAAILTICALITIVVCGEFLPKSLAVTYPMTVVRWVAAPLALALRLIDVFLPIIKLVNEASRRVIWPGFKSESYLELADLDRAIKLSTADAQLYEQESQVLRNVVRLSEIRVEEWMLPRTQYQTFAPPVSFDQLEGQKTPSGYMLITDPDGKDVVSVVDLSALSPANGRDIERYMVPPVVVPWCTTMADALRELKDSGRKVGVVVNEYGETIGILTWEELIEAILQAENTQSHRELAKAEIHAESENVWLATGLTKLRRLERVLGRRLSTARGLTIGGVIHEQLHRLPETGDVCQFEGMRLEVVDAGLRGESLVRIRLEAAGKEESE